MPAKGREMIDPDSEKAIQPHLTPGEHLLWSAKAPPWRSASQYITPIVISPVWVVVTIAIFIAAGTTDSLGVFASESENRNLSTTVFFSLLAAITIGGGLYFLWLSVRNYDAALSQHYGLTNQRVIIASMRYNDIFRSIGTEWAASVRTSGLADRDDIILSTAIPTSVLKKPFEDTKPVILFNVEHANEVAALIRQTLKTKREGQP